MPSLDDWEMDAAFSHIAEVLGVDNSTGHGSRPVSRNAARVDNAHAKLRPRHGRPKKPMRRVAAKAHRGDYGGPLLALVIWAFLSLGTAALVCGGMLLAWSFVAARAELWKLGLPIAVGGQIALFIGLLLQIDRFWRDTRRTSRKLAQVDAKLRDLQTTAAGLSVRHGPSPKSPRSHLAAADDDPARLLGDLKNRLDALGTKIDQAE
jgi:hypothetical protein